MPPPAWYVPTYQAKAAAATQKRAPASSLAVAPQPTWAKRPTSLPLHPLPLTRPQAPSVSCASASEVTTSTRVARSFKKFKKRMLRHASPRQALDVPEGAKGTEEMRRMEHEKRMEILDVELRLKQSELFYWKERTRREFQPTTPSYQSVPSQ